MQSCEIYKILTQEDTKARNLFVSDFKTSLSELSDLLSDAFSCLESSDCRKDESDRAGIVSVYLYLTMESVVSAVHLLSLGHIAPSGNSMRSSYESLCMAALIKKEIKIKLNKTEKVHFYNEFRNNSKSCRPDNALNLAIKNKSLLGLNDQNVRFLRKAKDFYNRYSHSTQLFAHSKIRLSTRQIYVGGGYENERKKIFKSQIDFIYKYAYGLKAWIQAIAYNGT